MAGEDLELLIDDPTVDAPVKVDGKPEERKPEAPAVDQGIDVLRRQLAEAQRRASQSDQVAAQAISEAEQARAYAGNTQYQAITGALDQRKERVLSLKEELKNATAVGDGERVADLTEALADAKFDLRRLEEGKATLEARLQRGQETAREQPRQPAGASADDGLSDPARAWIARNPESVTDPQANARMMAGHWSALGQGIEADTPEYFAHLDKVYKGKAAPAEPERGRVADAEPEVPRPQARYAAPVERDAGPRKVQLRITPEMREAAAMADLTIEEYAKEYVKLHGVR